MFSTLDSDSTILIPRVQQTVALEVGLLGNGKHIAFTNLQEVLILVGYVLIIHILLRIRKMFMDMLGTRCIRITLITVPVVRAIALEINPMRFGLIITKHIHTVWITMILISILNAAITKFLLVGNPTREVTIHPGPSAVRILIKNRIRVAYILTLAILPTLHPITNEIIRCWSVGIKPSELSIRSICCLIYVWPRVVEIGTTVSTSIILFQVRVHIIVFNLQFIIEAQRRIAQRC